MKNILFAALLFFCKGCAAQTVSQLPEVIISSEIKSPMKGDVKFAVENKSDSLLYYYIGIEAEIEGQWQEVIIDLNKDGDPRSARILKINPKELNNFTFNSEKKMKNVRKSLTHFRLKMSYGFSVDSLDNRIYSTPFDIER